MRRLPASIALLALGVTLLVDVLRVWLPSIITIFGQAASTPAELMGAFALLWFVLAGVVPPVVRAVGARPVALVSAVVLVGCRVALAGSPGGQVQLYLASVGLLAGLAWLAATAASTARPVPGIVFGLAGAAAAHTALHSYDLTWRGTPWSWAAVAAVAMAFLALQGLPSRDAGTDHRRPPVGDWAPPDPGGGIAPWLLLGPSLLLTAMVAGSPALATVALSYLSGSVEGSPAVARPPALGVLLPALLCAVAVGLFVGAGSTRPPSGRWRWLAPGLLLAGVALFASGWIAGLVPAILFTAAGLGGCLSLAAGGAGPATNGPATAGGAGRAGARRGFAVVGGLLLFAVAAVLYYAGYDLGYPNQSVPVAIGLLVAVVALRTPAPPAGTPPPPCVSPAHPARAWVAASVVAALTAVGALAVPQGATVRQGATAPVRDAAAGSVRLVAYNIRMGFGLDGRFDLNGLVEVIAGQAPDVVALSEVDRAWLLNGGHDTLALLARRLDMAYRFAPAADAVWGDAVLSRLPIRQTRTERLSAVGAPTGAQALAVTLDVGGRELVLVSTHLQPPPDDGPVVQAREVARFASGFAAGRPLVVAGDLNTEPGEPAFEALRQAGLVDALASARPLPTSPSDVPVQEIDHVLASPGIAAADPVAPRSTASDHLPVAVTLTLPPS